jgi:hypothetical protein
MDRPEHVQTDGEWIVWLLGTKYSPARASDPEALMKDTRLNEREIVAAIRSLEGMKAISVFRNRSRIVSLGLIHPVGYALFDDITGRK